MLSVLSAVVWMVFATVGIMGFRLAYARPTLPEPEHAPVTIERLDVTVFRSPSRSFQRSAAGARTPIPTPAPAAVLPDAPMLPVAETSLSVPFPVAARLPARVAVANVPAPVEQLTFGQGEGDQPAPDYPTEAKIAHQEGDVVVRMTIGKNGEITDATVTTPCRWPILNQAALQVVRDSWHFGNGPVRRKEIQFIFKLYQR